MLRSSLPLSQLEAVRLTRDQCAALKKMKEERVKYMNRSKELEKINEKLRTGASPGGEVSMEVHDANLAEISRLKESNDALGDKLRKYAKHCQKLEGEKAAVVDAISKSELGKSDDLDAESEFVGTMATILERLTSAEEEVTALISAETRANAYLMQLDRAKEDQKKAEGDAEVLKEKIEKFTIREGEMSVALNEAETKLASIQVERDELAAASSSVAQEKAQAEGESAKQLKFLQSENLQLMMDTKNLKRALLTTKAELEAYRSATVRSPLIERSSNVKATPSSGKTKSVISGSGRKSSTKKLSARKTIASLGEVGELDDDNTAECKQS